MRMNSSRILIFGGTGSLGRALINRWGRDNSLGVFSRDEAKHWTIRNQLNPEQNAQFFVGDVRDANRVKEVIREFKPQIIIIAAALKQVDTCEFAPTESLKTNVQGVANIIESCTTDNNHVEDLHSILMVSTDKACSPTNVYGMSKALAERLVVGLSRSSKSVRFLGVRYGNVLDSRGSIVPLFRYQAQSGESFTLTDKRMTRFLMTLDESIDLIENALAEGENGDFWIPKLRSMKILDLAEIFSSIYGKSITEIGIRAGEKLHEDLVSSTESLRAVKIGNRIVLKPESNSRLVNQEVWSYSSELDNISKVELEKFLRFKGVFDTPLEHFIGRDIEEIRTSDFAIDKNS